MRLCGLFTVVCILLFSIPARAATWNIRTERDGNGGPPDSCEAADIQWYDMNEAADGDILQLPSCNPGLGGHITGIWTTGQGYSSIHAITLQGNGCTLGTLGSITNVPTSCNTILSVGGSSGLITLFLVANKVTRITGIAFEDHGSSLAPAQAVIQFQGADGGGTIDNRRYRFDHCMWTRIPNGVLNIYKSYGVIDHLNADVLTNLIYFNQHNDPAWGYARWQEATNFGTDKFAIYENNYFAATHNQGELFGNTAVGQLSITSGVAVGTGSFSPVTQSATSGSGTGANFIVQSTGSNYTAVLVDTLAGYGYAVNDTVTIPGTQLGGSSPTNDLVITVNAVTAQQFSLTDGFGGARYVTRFNEIHNLNIANHGIDGSGIDRGTRAQEIYQNIMIGQNVNSTVFDMRSGVIMAWGNPMTGFTAPASSILKYEVLEAAGGFGSTTGTNPFDINNSGNPKFTFTAAANSTGPDGNGDFSVTVANQTWTTNQFTGYVLNKHSCLPIYTQVCSLVVISNDNPSSSTGTIKLRTSNPGVYTIPISMGSMFDLNLVDFGVDAPCRRDNPGVMLPTQTGASASVSGTTVTVSGLVNFPQSATFVNVGEDPVQSGFADGTWQIATTTGCSGGVCTGLTFTIASPGGSYSAAVDVTAAPPAGTGQLTDYCYSFLNTVGGVNAVSDGPPPFQLTVRPINSTPAGSYLDYLGTPNTPGCKAMSNCTFDGSSYTQGGVGVGLLADMPSSGLAGMGYWAVDSCSGPNCNWNPTNAGTPVVLGGMSYYSGQLYTSSGGAFSLAYTPLLFPDTLAGGPQMVFHTPPSDTHTTGTMTSFQVYATTDGLTIDTSFGGTVTLTDNSCGPTWSGLTATASMGVATFSSVVGTGPSSGVCTFTAAAMSYTNGVSGSFWIGPNQQAVTTQPSSSYTSGATANVTITSQFGDGTTDTASTASKTITMIGSPCTGSISGGTTTQNDTAGVNAFSVTVSTVSSTTGCEFHSADNTFSMAAVNSNAFAINSSGTAPSITVQPQSQSITTGQMASLSVTATGTATLHYQWWLGSGCSGTMVGSDANTFITPGLSVTTTYSVMVSNSFGMVCSSNAVITVNPPIVINNGGIPRVRARIR